MFAIEWIKTLDFRLQVVHINAGNTQRRRAILAKGGITFINIAIVLSGHRTSKFCHNISKTNMHVPSGTNKRGERNSFVM